MYSICKMVRSRSSIYAACLSWTLRRALSSRLSRPTRRCLGQPENTLEAFVAARPRDRRTDSIQRRTALHRCIAPTRLSCYVTDVHHILCLPPNQKNLNVNNDLAMGRQTSGVVLPCSCFQQYENAYRAHRQDCACSQRVRAGRRANSPVGIAERDQTERANPSINQVRIL